MSVVSAMVFNEKEGAIVSDEMGSSQVRKYLLFNKLKGYKVNGSGIVSIIGGAGGANFLKLNLDFLMNAENNPDIHSSEDFMDYFANVVYANKMEMIENILKTATGISWDEFKAGHFVTKTGETVPIEENLKKCYEDVLNGENPTIQVVYQTEFLSLNRDNSGIQIYFIESAPNVKPTQLMNYKSIGSGADIADYVIYSFFEKIPREERNNINRIDGLATLLQASDRAAAMNHGIGGTYYVGIISGSEIINPSENNTRLASEIVKAHKKGYLSKNFVRSSLQNLLYENMPFESVEEKMFTAARGKGRDMLRMLRGYKV